MFLLTSAITVFADLAHSFFIQSELPKLQKPCSSGGEICTMKTSIGLGMASPMSGTPKRPLTMKSDFFWAIRSRIKGRT